MLEIHKDDGRSPKIAFTHSLLPGYIDPQNVSTKKKPFSVINAQKFSHTLDLILPAEIYDLISTRLDLTSSPSTTSAASSIGRSQYARVYMSLSEILSGDFFTSYIRHGNIMMRSEGRSNIDNVLSLYNSTLRLEVSRDVYEKLGLQGRAIEDGGAKHKKNRWVVEIDLRQKSMVHGKKGFGRLEWAARNVLSQSLVWLFYNANPNSREAMAEGREPIARHAPAVRDIVPSVGLMKDVLVPRLAVGDLPGLYEQEDSLGLLEWLDLVSLDSPRIRQGDRIDPFLARYDVPDFGKGAEVRDLVRVRWRGFIPPLFVRELFLAVRKEGLRVGKDEQDGEGGTIKGEEKRWFAMSARGIEEGEGYTVMQWAGRETLCWEVL
ncbi:hypothetical protein K491DRAFT_587237 [Lophiostoma macrostomum CBS 122681]|uniref:Uncharacterized protein n=1 Tax=Lophiostoma macrostomum CBS 122681 TaxID=1314788 RepID=A0A6A6TNU6_9PLEO|nr:hypothetical protein K491DRAFT_587237 [Lophiostoma macrostomum CBS 122681]